MKETLKGKCESLNIGAIYYKDTKTLCLEQEIIGYDWLSFDIKQIEQLNQLTTQILLLENAKKIIT
jgi:hypothetical protein